MRRQCRCSSGNGPSPCSTRPAAWSNWTRSQALQLLPHPLPAGRRLAGLRWPEWTRAGCQGCRACPSWQWGSEDVLKNADYYLTRQTFKAKNHQPGNSPKLRMAQARNVPDDVAVAKAGIDLALNLGHGQTQWLLTVEVAQHLLAVGARSDDLLPFTNRFLIEHQPHRLLGSFLEELGANAQRVYHSHHNTFGRHRATNLGWNGRALCSFT